MAGFAPSFRDREGATPTIYLDGVRIRDSRTLGSISVTDLDSMEYLDGPTATIRYGTGHVGGAIVIKTVKG
jgi:outer membrane cobalamin receptor